MIWLMTDDVWQPVARRVQHELDQMGVASIILDPEAARNLVVRITGTTVEVWIEDTALDTPAAVLYLRDPVPHPGAESGIDADIRGFVVQQWQMMLRGLMTAMDAAGVPMVNPVQSLLVDEKTAQLVRAAQVGFATPETMHTAVGAHAERFADGHAQRSATKPFAPFMRRSADGESMQRLLTNLTSPNDLRRGLDRASVPSPTIVQPFVTAAFEHRVVVVGERVFGARIRRSGANAVDVRRLSPSKADVTASVLPPDVEAKCIELVHTSGLKLAAIDLLETEDNYVFLDLNPSGHFLWVEQVTGAPICEAIAQLLATSSQVVGFAAVG